MKGPGNDGNPPGAAEGPRPLRVVAVAVIVDTEDRILFLLRSSALKAGPGKWGFAGGGVEPGESPEEAMYREIREELGLDTHLALESCIGPLPGLGHAHLVVHLFKFKWLGGTVNLNEEHSRYAWIREEDYGTLDVIAGVDADLDYFGLWPGRRGVGHGNGHGYG